MAQIEVQNMPGILLKEVPEALHEKLKARAATNRRSMSSELLCILERALTERAGPPTLEEIDRLRVRGTKLLDQALLDLAREDGRP